MTIKHIFKYLINYYFSNLSLEILNDSFCNDCIDRLNFVRSKAFFFESLLGMFTIDSLFIWQNSLSIKKKYFKIYFIFTKKV